MSSSSASLVLDNVSRSFGGLKAVDGVALVVRGGERRAVIGPNGAGKTTLFNLISGELRPTAGTITMFGADITRLTPFDRAGRGLARTFQITRLFPNLTVYDNVVLACEALDRRKFTIHRPLRSCRPLTERASRVLDRFGLAAFAEERARNLAYGDQRKLEVALTMAGRPRVLLLDEPMAGLSAEDRDAMCQVIESLDRDIAILLIEHDMDVAFRIADTVTVMAEGRVIFEGTPDKVAADAVVQQIYLGQEESSKLKGESSKSVRSST